MKKLFLISLMIVVVGSLVLGGCAKPAPPPAPVPAPTPAPPTPQVFELRLQAMLAPGSEEFRNVFEGPRGLPAVIKEVSGGRINITAYGAGELVPLTEQFEAVGKGTLDMSMSPTSLWAGKTPVAAFGWGLPYTLKGAEETSIFYRRLGVLDIIRDAFTKFNVYLIDITPAGAAALFSKKAIYKVDDFKGLKIRATGLSADVYIKAGASATYIPTPEIYTALERGVIDAASFGSEYGGKTLGFHEVTHYLLLPYQTEAMTSELLINMDVWKALPDDLKAIFEWGCIGHSWIACAELNTYLGMTTRRWLLDEYGMEEAIMPEEEVAKLGKIAVEVIDEYAARDPACGEVAKILKDLLRLRGRL